MFFKIKAKRTTPSKTSNWLSIYTILLYLLKTRWNRVSPPNVRNLNFNRCSSLKPSIRRCLLSSLQGQARAVSEHTVSFGPRMTECILPFAHERVPSASASALSCKEIGMAQSRHRTPTEAPPLAFQANIGWGCTVQPLGFGFPKP